jgi:hypothetical protein
MAADRVIDVEVVAHVTGSMNHCDHCQVFIDGVGIGDQIHQQDIQSYPEEFIRDWQRVSDWVLDLAATFPGQLVIRITDAQSMQGLWKSLTKGVRKYPTFIVDGEEKYHGWEAEALNEVIRRHLPTVNPPASEVQGSG